MVELAIDFCEPESRRDTCFPKLRDAEFPDMEGGPVAIGKNPSGDDTIDSGFSAKVYHHLGRNEITAFLRQNDKFDKFDGLENNNWWCLLAYMCDITEKLNELNRGLQGENNIISQMANKVLTFEEKLGIYYKEMQNRVLHNFPTLIKAKQDNIIISETNNMPNNKNVPTF
ncbi:hypothetical protein QTP88_008746 [Uroleucon formosanum]